VTRHGYHCRGQPGLAHGNLPLSVVKTGCGSRPVSGSEAIYRKNVSLKSGTTSSNPTSSSAESAANLTPSIRVRIAASGSSDAGLA